MLPLTKPQFLSILQKFLPEGAAWPRALESVLANLLSSFAYMFALLELRLRDLLAELNPATADQLLAEWEAFVGSCDACCTSVAGTVAERRARVVAKLNEQGSLSRAYFLQLALDLGYADTTIIECEPMTCDMACDSYVMEGDLWRYVWMVNLPHQGNNYSIFSAESLCTDPLDFYLMGVLECVFMRLKPAHTYVIFTYEGLP